MDEVKTSELTKRFDKIVAVDNVELTVPQGTIYGLLGPNGAGKSTTVRLLCTLLRPTMGTATVAGHDILKEPVEVRKSCGVLPEEGSHTLYPTLTVYQNLEYFARLYDIPESEIPSRIEELLNFMELWDRRNDKADELSTGNRQRLALCRALLHRPKVLLLDEPTAALDPIAAKRVRELILRLSKTYRQTFFINSHNLAEVQRICDRIAIIDRGKIVIAGETRELLRRFSPEQKFRVRVYEDIEKAHSIISSQEYVEEAVIEEDTIVIKIRDPVENNSRLLKTMIDQGMRIIEFSEEEISLEDLYLRIMQSGG